MIEILQWAIVIVTVTVVFAVGLWAFHVPWRVALTDYESQPGTLTDLTYIVSSLVQFALGMMVLTAIVFWAFNGVFGV